MTRPLSIDRILTAATLIDARFLDTPVLGRTALDTDLGCGLLLKVECLNPIRSFKGRGAELFVATELTPGAEVACASAGNFGQAMAYAAGRRGYRCTVFAAETASEMKIAAMRRLGVEVLLAGADFEAAKSAAAAHASLVGARFVEDGPSLRSRKAPARLVLSWRDSPSWTGSSSRSATVPCSPESAPRFGTSPRALG